MGRDSTTVTSPIMSLSLCPVQVMLCCPFPVPRGHIFCLVQGDEHLERTALYQDHSIQSLEGRAVTDEVCLGIICWQTRDVMAATQLNGSNSSSSKRAHHCCMQSQNGFKSIISIQKDQSWSNMTHAALRNMSGSLGICEPTVTCVGTGVWT